MSISEFSLASYRDIQIFIDTTDKNYEGLEIFAEAFATDVERVMTRRPKIVTDRTKLQEQVIVIGTIGGNSLINKLVEEGKLDIKDLDGKRECYSIRLIKDLTEHIKEALVIVGSDKRGCAYGTFYISELMGVSPWVWFADVAPLQRERIVLKKEEVEKTSKEASVRFRGIFINDESPSFTTWAKTHFGGLNEKMYAHVFELILRLKGNYLWPAMWDNNFSEDGDATLYANIQLAHKYGVVMGTSHHEPMCRAGVEWQRIYKDYSQDNAWDFQKNREAISAFWQDGIKRNKAYENVITIGMRGECDSVLEGSMGYNVNLLKDIILTQKTILKEEGMNDVPKMLVVYKEVENYWNGGKDLTTGEEVEGLKLWKDEEGKSPLDDTIIMLCEDNYGNVRSLPTKARSGGWGMYYHFDYNGGPRGYMWLNVMQLEKTWEQLSQAYDYNVRECWIVNVGDLKPMEMQISYYMDLAYDFDTYGTEGTITPGAYYKLFVEKQFAYGIEEKEREGIAEVLADYCKLNQMCRPEYAREDIYSITHEEEAPRMLKRCLDLERRAYAYKKCMPAALKDAYEQLVYYPAVASANIVAMYIYLAYNKKYAADGNEVANHYGALFEACVQYDKILGEHYNRDMAKGKWQGMMLQNHYGYTNWHHESIEWPTAIYIGKREEGVPIEVVRAENAHLAQVHPMIQSILDEVEKGSRQRLVRNERLEEEAVEKKLPIGTYVAHEGIISIAAEQFVRSVTKGVGAWQVIPNYGRYTGAIKVYPTTANYSQLMEEAPFVEYAIYIQEEGEYTLRSYTSPSNHLDGDEVTLRYGVSCDFEKVEVIDTLPQGFRAGDCYEPQWCHGVSYNIHITESKLKLMPGLHTVQFYNVDPGLVLQKLVLYKGNLPSTYLGPIESYKVEVQNK